MIFFSKQEEKMKNDLSAPKKYTVIRTFSFWLKRSANTLKSLQQHYNNTKTMSLEYLRLFFSTQNLPDAQMQNIAYPKGELQWHVTLKFIQAGSLLGSQKTHSPPLLLPNVIPHPQDTLELELRVPYAEWSQNRVQN